MPIEILDNLRRRRRELRIPLPVLSARSGVSLSTLKRMLRAGNRDASLENVCAVADAMGVTIRGEPKTDATTYREKIARAKAKKLVGMVQGTSRLESQAVPSRFVAEMTKQTTHELVAGPNRRLWSP